MLCTDIFQNTMDENWEVNSMMEFDHHQNIARAAFGDMLYDSDRVNMPYELKQHNLKYDDNCFSLTESVVL